MKHVYTDTSVLLRWILAEPRALEHPGLGFATHDETLARAATAMGFDVTG